MLGWILDQTGRLDTIENAIGDESSQQDHKREGRGAYEHLYKMKLNDGYTIYINSLRSSIVILSDDVFHGFESGQALGNSRLEAFLVRKFSASTDEIQASYRAEKLKFKSERNIVFGICPSFECNLKCTYCFQQHSKTLNKTLISDENLQLLFNRIRASRHEHPERQIVIDLFGGEPFQEPNRAVLRKIFGFAREHKLILTATTNGYDLDRFWDLVVPYHGYIGRIGITLDGPKSSHDRRRIAKDTGQSFEKIVGNINVLLKLGIHVTVSTNLDQKNIHEFKEYLGLMRSFGWADHPLVRLEVGRVDDRLFDLKYKSYLSEGELLHLLIEMEKEAPFPSNVKFAFLKSTLKVARALGLSFNSNEQGRLNFNYCWATSDVDDRMYVDSELNTYRCTYTVGKADQKTGNLKTGIDTCAWDSQTYFRFRSASGARLAAFAPAVAFSRQRLIPPVSVGKKKRPSISS